jgi:hypothetical protein
MIEVLDSLFTEYKENVQQCLEKIQPLPDVLQPPITSVDFEQAEEIPKLFPSSDTVDPVCLETEFEIFPQVVVEVEIIEKLRSKFWGIFSSLVDNNKSLSDAIKLAHLNNSINDRVREVIACLTGEPGDYQKAVKLLSDRYGDPREVVDAHLHRITNWHNIKEKDRDAFERFADALQAAVFALDKPDYRHELSSMPLCTQLVRKLPPSEKDEWVRQVERKQVAENVKGLAEYAQLRVKSLRKRDRYNTPAPPKEDPKFNPKFAHKRTYLAKAQKNEKGNVQGNVLYATVLRNIKRGIAQCF